jgi:hypothetical protein
VIRHKFRLTGHRVPSVEHDLRDRRWIGVFLGFSGREHPAPSALPAQFDRVEGEAGLVFTGHDGRFVGLMRNAVIMTGASM